jgi:hypothetical protein
MKVKRLLALLVLLSLVFSANAPAQTPQDTAPGGVDPARKELEQKAVGLLEGALKEAEGLKLVENRVRAETIAVGLLWPRDEEAARAAFKAAADGIAALNAGLDPEDQQFFNAAQAVAQMRNELLQTAAPRDPKLALDFLRATRQQHPEAFPRQNNWLLNQEQTMEANLVGQIAEQDPRQALSLAEETLGRGLTTGLLGAVSQLNAKDPAAASKLAGEIIQKLGAEDLDESGEASGVALQLLTMTRPVEPSSAPPDVQVQSISGPVAYAYTVGGARSPNGLSVDPQARADLVEKVIAAALRAQPNRGGSYNLFQAIQTLMPELEKSAPARVAALRQKAASLERGFNPQADVWKPYQDLMQKGTVEAILEAAPKAPAEVRDQLYNQAVWKTFNEGNDPERARQIIENISNPQQRAQLRRSIEQQLQWREAQQGNYAGSLRMVSSLPTVEEKVQALVQIAGAASSKGDKQTALQVLAQARGLLDGQSHNYGQFTAGLQVANAYAPLDAEASFTMVESAVAQLNDLLDAAAVVNGFGQDSFKDGELRLQQGGYPWAELIGQCASALAALAPSDFDRASNDARSFRRADARAMAELILAQNLLGQLTPQRPQRRFYRGRGLGVAIDK